MVCVGVGEATEDVGVKVIGTVVVLLLFPPPNIPSMPHRWWVLECVGVGVGVAVGVDVGLSQGYQETQR